MNLEIGYNMESEMPDHYQKDFPNIVAARV